MKNPPSSSLIRNNIAKLAKEKGISANRIEQYLNKSHPYGIRIFRQKFQPSIYDLCQISKLLGEDYKKLIYIDYSLIKAKSKKIDK